MKALLLVNRVWDLVSSKRTRLNPAPALVFGEGVTDQAAIDEATKRLDDFEDAYNKAACLITESISNAENLSVTTVLEDPVATWCSHPKRCSKIDNISRRHRSKPSHRPQEGVLL